MPYRVGVTGSRTWARPAPVRREVARVLHDHPDTVLVSGYANRGLDPLAEHIWAALLGYRNPDEAAQAGRIERHPADWARYNSRAGFIRNQEMVDAGADEWLAFARSCVKPSCRTPGQHDTHGTADCIDRADRARIPVHYHYY